MPEAPSPPRPEKGLMGVASEGCQGRGETGAGAAAAVATGKEESGEGGVGEGGWEVRMGGKEKTNGK